MPFPFLRRCREDAEELLKQIAQNKVTAEEKALVESYDDYTRKSARYACIKYEEDQITKILGDNGVEVVPVSAKQYSFWKGWDPDKVPEIYPEATGIPTLRQFLLQLPAQTNYETLKHHVFEILPQIAKHIDRILTKFDEDVSYARMRKHLKEQLSLLPDILTDLARKESHSHVDRPWACGDQKIEQRLRAFSREL